MKVHMDDGFYVISDTHFYHERLAFDFGLRTQFKNINEMNKTIFNNWNNLIKDGDKVFFLGDFVIGANSKYSVSQVIWDRLPGDKYFLKGNHDEHIKEMTTIPVIEDNDIEVSYKGMNILMSHKPQFTFDHDIHICGHIHNNHENEKLKWNMFNASVEMIEYTPVHIDDVIQEIKDRANNIYNKADRLR